MSQDALGTAQLLDQEVWRVGWQPDPWAFNAWSYSTDGIFPGRWDSPDPFDFRTLYVGQTLLGCLLEVLADHRRDAVLASDLDAIEISDEDEPEPVQPGELPIEWVENRLIGRAHLSGTFCQVSSRQSLIALYPRFLQMAVDLGHADFDASSLRSGDRSLTQPIAAHLHRTTLVDGIQFESRWGDDETLWAVFERGSDTVTSPMLTEQETFQLSAVGEDLRAAMTMLGLAWEALPESAVMPYEAASEEEAMRHTFPPDGEPTPFTPLGAAMLWWQSLLRPGYETARDVLTFDPAGWDFEEVRTKLSSRSFRTRVERPYPEDQDIAYVGLVDSPAQTVRVLESAPVSTLWLVMVRVDQLWKVWGLPPDENLIYPRNLVRG